MSRRSIAAAALGSLLSAIVVMVWVIPTVFGPRVDCGEIDPAACDRIWRDTAVRIGGIQQLFPVTSAEVSGTETCPQVVLEWFGGVMGAYVESFC